MLGGRLSRVMLIAAAVALAGCSQAPVPNPDADPPPGTITDPLDYSYLNGNASGRHVHDYWGGKQRHVALEVSFSLGGGPLGQPSFYELTEEHPQWSVWPGTRWVNITTSWQSEQDVGLHLQWGSRQPSSPNGSGQAALADGEPLSINTSEPMNDLAHSTTTRWTLFYTFAQSHTPWAPETVVDVRVEIARPLGPLPLAPPHPDHWGNNETHVLHRSSGPIHDTWYVPLGQSYPPSSPLLDDGPGIVPPQTGSLVLTVRYNSSTDPRLHYAPTLDWRGADGDVHQGVAPTTQELRSQNGLYEWRIDVEPNQWDSPYANATQWVLWIRWHDDSGLEPEEPVYMDGDYRLRVAIHRAQ